MQRPIWDNPTPIRGGLWTAWTALGVAVGLSLSAFADPPQTGSELVRLSPAVAKSAFFSSQLNVQRRAAPFNREPQVSSNRVSRGLFQTGKSSTNRVGFLWDPTASTLYLDLNDNQDLTDDPDGVFKSKNGGRSSYQLFEGVRFPQRATAAGLPVVADLGLYAYQSTPYCTASLRSYWKGRFSSGERDWEIGILPTPFLTPRNPEDPKLLIRPWTASDAPFVVQDRSAQVLPFRPVVFLDHRSYSVDPEPAPEPAGDPPVLCVRFTPTNAPLGTLRISGSGIEQLALLGGPELVVLTRPGAAVQVPAGTYQQANPQLGSNVVAVVAQASSVPGPAVVVPASGEATLATGGPLTNWVTLDRRGRMLLLSYEVRGAGGATYRLGSRGAEPEFRIYRGGREVASGKFEFG